MFRKNFFKGREIYLEENLIYKNNKNVYWDMKYLSSESKLDDKGNGTIEDFLPFTKEIDVVIENRISKKSKVK